MRLAPDSCQDHVATRIITQIEITHTIIIYMNLNMKLRHVGWIKYFKTNFANG